MRSESIFGTASGAPITLLVGFIAACGGAKLDPFQNSAAAGAGGSSNAGAGGGGLAVGGTQNNASGGAGSAGISSGGGGGTQPLSGRSSGGAAGESTGEGGAPDASAGAAGTASGGGGVDPGSACYGQTNIPQSLLANCEMGIGGWFGYEDDRTVAIAEEHPGADGTSTAARFSGGNAAASGVGIGMFCDDVSSYEGVTFWAKGRGGDHVRFLAAIPATDATPGRGDCDPLKVRCNDHPGLGFTLEHEWQQYTVHFEQLAQYGWGEPAKFSGIVNSLLWINDGPVDGFEFAIDEVRLVKREK